MYSFNLSSPPVLPLGYVNLGWECDEGSKWDTLYGVPVVPAFIRLSNNALFPMKLIGEYVTHLHWISALLSA